MTKRKTRANFQPKITKAQIHKQVADQVIEAMLTAGTDWVKNWSVPKAMQPTSLSTGKQYNGINWLILSMRKASRGYRTSEWATFQQWKKLGASVKKGEKSTLVVLYKTVQIKDKETEETQHIPMMKHFRVFNADQVEGYEPVIPEDSFADLPATEADKVATLAGATVKNGDAARAYYAPKQDFINMPFQAQFDSPEGYACTLLHELTHWTGHKSRLDRDAKTGFGTKDYAFEELVAELGAAMLAGSLGICAEPRDDHAKYLNSWIKVLKDDPQVIFKAAAKANQAAQFILNAADQSQEKVAA